MSNFGLMFFFQMSGLINRRSERYVNTTKTKSMSRLDEECTSLFVYTSFSRCAGAPRPVQCFVIGQLQVCQESVHGDANDTDE